MTNSRTVVSIAEAKKSLSALIKRAAAGERIEIGAYGYAQVALVPAQVRETGVRCGSLAGRLIVPADFDAALPDAILNEFEGMGD
jgi:antitoxin (DNA-binding transcriptional repressor) of toxin-antitoxin stability system